MSGPYCFSKLIEFAQKLKTDLNTNNHDPNKLNQFVIEYFDENLSVEASLDLLYRIHEQCTPIPDDAGILKRIRQAIDAKDTNLEGLLHQLYAETQPELYRSLQQNDHRLNAKGLMAICGAYGLNPLAQQDLLKNRPIHSLFSISAGFSREESCGSTTAFSTGLLAGEKPAIYTLGELELGKAHNKTFAPWVERTVFDHDYCFFVMPIKDPKNPDKQHWATVFITDPECKGRLSARYFSTVKSSDIEVTTRDMLKSWNIFLDETTVIESNHEHSAEAGALYTFLSILKQKVHWRSVQINETPEEVVDKLPKNIKKIARNVGLDLKAIANSFDRLSPLSFILEELLESLNNEHAQPYLPARIRTENIKIAALNISKEEFIRAVQKLSDIIDCPISSDPNKKEVAFLLLSILAIASGQYAHLKLLTITGATGCTALVGFKLTHTDAPNREIQEQLMQFAHIAVAS